MAVLTALEVFRYCRFDITLLIVSSAFILAALVGLSGVSAAFSLRLAPLLPG